MSSILRYRMAVHQTREVISHLCVVGGYWCKYSDHIADRKADKKRIKELEGTLNNIRAQVDKIRYPANPNLFDVDSAEYLGITE